MTVPGITITQITNNNYYDGSPRILEDYMIWGGYDGNDSEIFIYDGHEIKQITNNDYVDYPFFQISDNYTIWEGYDGNDFELFLYDGNEVIKLTDNDYRDEAWKVSFSGKYIVWNTREDSGYSLYVYDGSQIIPLQYNDFNNNSFQWRITEDYIVWNADNGGDSEILLYDFQQSKIVQLTNNDQNDYFHAAWISGKNVVWASYDGNDHEIFFYDGNQIIQLTDNDSSDVFSAISGNRAAWEGYDGNDYEIFLYDGNEIKQLTDNEFTDIRIKISDNYIAWEGYDGNDYELFLYDGINTLQLTNNDSNDSVNEIDLLNDTAVWEASDGNDGEIFIYDGNEIINLTNNNFNDRSLRVLENKLIWIGNDGNDDEIFLYDLENKNGIIQLTDNDVNYSSSWSVVVSGNYVVWSSSDGEDDELFLYDGNKTTQLTDNNDTDYVSQVTFSDKYITYSSNDGNNIGIFIYVYDLERIIRVANHTYDYGNITSHSNPVVSENHILWGGSDGSEENDAEIFLAEIDFSSLANVSNNYPPTNFTLSNNNIAENKPINSLIGDFTTIDLDTGNTFTYTLVSGIGSTDNNLFTIENNQLKTNAIFDYEYERIYNIRVRTTDEDGLSLEKALIINVDNIPESPTNIILSNSEIAENQPINTVIGNFTTIDSDWGNTFTYTLVSGIGSTDNNLFSIDNNQLKTNAIFDYETKNSYNIRVRTTDEDGLSFEKALIINVDNIPESPTNIILSNSAIAENKPINSLIGDFTTIYSNSGNTFTYTLVSGIGSTDNNLFSIDNNQLKTNAIFDYETKNSYNIRVRTTHQDGLSFEKALTINIDNVNEGSLPIIKNPIGQINASENADNTNIDLLAHFDDPFTTGQAELNFSLVSNSNPNLVDVSINNSQLVLDYQDEQTGTAEIIIQVTSLLGYAIEHTFNIDVNVNERSPINLNLSNHQISENLGINTLIGTFSITSPDVNNTFTYSLVSGAGSMDNSLFTITNNKLLSNGIFDYETKNNYSIKVRTTDQNGLFYEEALEINILNLNEAPSNVSLNLEKNSYHPSETVDIIGNIRDEDGNDDLAKVDIRLRRSNGIWKKLTNLETFESDGDFNYQLDLEDYRPGTYQIRARAQDKQGALTSWVRQNFTIENNAPNNLTLTLNQDNYHPSQTLTLMGNVEDEDGNDDLAKVDIRLRRSNGIWKKLTNLETFESDGDFNYQLDLDNYRTGNYQIRARVQDKQGAFTPWVRQNFTIQDNDPNHLTWTLNEPSYNASETLRLTGHVTEQDDELTGLSLIDTTAAINQVNTLTNTKTSDVSKLLNDQQIDNIQLEIEVHNMANKLDAKQNNIQFYRDQLEDNYLGYSS